MALLKKTFRYYYWLLIAFIKKNLKTIALTFLLTFILVVGIVSLSPIFESFVLVKKQMIGIVGKYNINKPPIEITNKISNGLVYIKSDGSIVPAIANSWEIKNNGKEFLVHLKQNLIWNDGKKFIADQVNYHFTDVKVNIIDDYTLSFVLKNPLPIFISYLNQPIVKSPLIGVGGLYRTGRIFIKNGSLNEIYLLPNKKGLSTVIYKFYDTDDQLVTAYKKGEINEFTSSKKSLIDPFYNWKNTQIEKTVDYTHLMTLFFNFQNKLLKERDIRSAIRMGINNKEFESEGQIASGPIPPISWAYNPDIKTAVWDQDTAKKIVTNSLSSTQSASLNLATYYEYTGFSDILSEQLQKIGFKINVNYLTQSLDNNFDLLLAMWKIPDDPDQYYFWHSAQTQTNIGSFKNLKIDKLLEDGRSTYLIKQRLQIYKDFQKTINDDPPALFLFYPYLYTVSKK